jgi:hypothetical protein
MAAIPQVVPATVRAIYAAYEKRRAETPARGYLGASVIGHACDRYLWLSFRWAGAEAFDGRMLRLFDQGHRAEARFVDELRMIGARCTRPGPTAPVRRRSLRRPLPRAHGWRRARPARGAEDLARAGVQDAQRQELQGAAGQGRARSKPMHWAQMQVYMLLTGMDRAMYLAENKDTADLYEERVALDKPEAERLVAARRSASSRPSSRRPACRPTRPGTCASTARSTRSATAPRCPRRRAAAARTRRRADGLWACAKHGSDDIPAGVQATGCTDHRFIPILLERLASRST